MSLRDFSLPFESLAAASALPLSDFFKLEFSVDSFALRALLALATFAAASRRLISFLKASSIDAHLSLRCPR